VVVKELDERVAVRTAYSPRSNGKDASPLGAHRAAGGREAAINAAPGVVLGGDLTLPSQGRLRGVVLFAHASRSTRRDPRNRVVVTALSRAGLATLLLDVFTAHEKVSHPTSADVELLSQRIVAATHWLRHQPETQALALGYLAASGSSAAALLAAAKLPEHIGAVVAWGGGGELAQASLDEIVAPVLLIVDGHAEDLERGCEMRRRLRCPTNLAVVPGATHAFEHFGPVQRAARLTADWFTRHLCEAAPVALPRQRELVR
jgi:putative phosphoribosyl transferase